MSEPRYKVGDLIEATKSEGKKVLLISKVEHTTLYDSTYDMITEEGKTIWHFCSVIDKEYHFRKIN